MQAHDEIRNAARDALIFAQAKMSIYYDKKHKPLAFKPDDKAFISLAGSMDTGYHLPNSISPKLSPQRVGPFEVIRAVSCLAYEPKIPPVISVAHLEPYKANNYDRVTTAAPEIVSDDTSEHEEWEAEEIMATRYNKRRKRNE